MSHCVCQAAPLAEDNSRKIVLVGNPNVGKSIFFSTWSGIYVDVSNFPGTTVEISQGKLGADLLLDTPGVYGVSSFNDEERVTRDVVLEADVVVNVVDATHLERDLFLTLQLIDMGIPMLIALNFCDEAEALGIKIDAGQLSSRLDVPVIPTSAVNGKGLANVYQAIDQARPGRSCPKLQAALQQFAPRIAHPPSALLILEADTEVAERYGVEAQNERENIYLGRRRRVDDIVAAVVQRPERSRRLRELIGRLCLNPWTGVPILIAVLFGCYQLVGIWIAGDIVGLTEGTLMQGYYEPWIRGLVSHWVSLESALGQILAGEFGVLTMTVTYLLGLLLPLVVGFYIALSVLEDSGYLPRLATLVDRMMTSIGLNGRAVIPIILGFGCVQLGTITTRILGSKRERTIATAILNFVIPCSAQIGVIVAMLAVVGLPLTISYVLVIFIVLAILGTVLNRMLPGQSSGLLIDLPPMRLPRLGNVLRKTGMRTFFFMKEAYLWFIAGSLGVSLLQVSGGLTAWQNALAPVTEGWLRLPKEAATAFVMGMVRRDFGAAGLTELPLAPWQVVSALVVITLFVPCIASLMILFKERGFREAMTIWAGAWVLAFSVGGVVSRLLG